MTYEALKNYCSVQAKLFGICTRIFDDGKMIDIFTARNPELTQEQLNEITFNNSFIPFGTSKKIDVYIEDIFCLGYIKDLSSGYTLMIGPTLFCETTENDIVEMLNKHGLPRILLESIIKFFDYSPVMSLEDFVSYLSGFNSAINNTVIPVEKILTDDKHTKLSQKYTVTSVSKVMDSQKKPHSSSEYEETLAYYIKNGMVEEIDKLSFNNYYGKVGKLGPSTLRSIKNALIVLNSLSMRAAVSGGLDRETASTVAELYAQRIENVQSVSELGSLSSIIRKDYCQRVNNLKTPEIKNPHIFKATKYIQTNLYKKITASDIAKFLNIRTEYLSVLFKEHLQCSVSEYINKQKIYEAKKLLRFTDKSLVEISSLLAFASQSHFQYQFKKIRGVTPTEYRNLYKK